MTQALSEAAKALHVAVAESVRRRALWFLVQGGLMVVTGIIAVAHPLIAALTTAAILGWLLIVSGVVQGLGLIGARHVPHFSMQLVSAILGVLVGFLLLSHPGEGLFALTLLLIVFFFVEGVAKIIFSLTVRPLPNWGWVLASGLVAVLLAAYLWSSLPISASWILGLLLGVTLITEGAALAFFAWSIRRSGTASG
jgi:uncharacterized membrane protein HdeD (DUF308 family)